VHFVPSGTGFVVGSSGTIRCTTNGGTNWISQISGTNNSLLDVRFSNISDVNNLYAIGMNGIILKTTNTGTNWNPLVSGTTNDLYEIHFTYTSVGYTVGQGGTILHTTNSGVNWVHLVSGTNRDLHSVYFPVPNTGYAVGSNGTILKTTSGYVSINPSGSPVPDKFCLFQNYPNPFNPITKIKFAVPVYSKVESPYVRLIIYDMLGKEAAVLINQMLQPGTYEVEWDGMNFTSGIYSYRLTSGDFTEVKKMVLIK
jgi:hypothetical protein